MFPIGIWDISLLFAAMAIILLTTSELLSPRNGRVNLKISKKRLTIAALTFSVLFVGTVVLRIAAVLLHL